MVQPQGFGFNGASLWLLSTTFFCRMATIFGLWSDSKSWSHRKRFRKQTLVTSWSTSFDSRSVKRNPDSFREKVSIKSELLLKAFLFADSCEIAFLIRLFHQNCQIIKRTIHLNIDVGVVQVVKNFLDFSEIICKGILG